LPFFKRKTAISGQPLENIEQMGAKKLEKKNIFHRNFEMAHQTGRRLKMFPCYWFDISSKSLLS
jgi:hypothetical protein